MKQQDEVVFQNMRKETRTPILFQDSKLWITEQHVAQKGQYDFEQHVQKYLDLQQRKNNLFLKSEQNLD